MPTSKASNTPSVLLTTGVSNSEPPIVIEDGERVYPCRCGETHRGDYGATDWGHHNCFHDAPLWPIDGDPGHFICASCGYSMFTKERYHRV